MKKRLSTSLIISLGILILSITISAVKTNTSPKAKPTTATAFATTDEIYVEKNEEMRGLWVSYLSLDMQNEESTFDRFKSKFDDIISEAKHLKCNTLIVQVRPFCDALYNSEIFPHSHILTGIQGQTPGFDALEYMCTEAHKNNLKLHAWINPLRVQNSNSAFELAQNNPYYLYEETNLSVNGSLYLNPASAKSREIITEGVKEIVSNYQVDGIQFDDYFYPEDITNEDIDDYELYKESVSNTPLSLHEWRTENINLLIAETYRAIKSVNTNTQFGISPQGNINNNDKLCADVKRWCETIGYVDYICPQLYFSTDNPALPFETALNQWKELNYHNNIKVYAGLAVYKAGSDSDNGTWLSKSTNLKDEVVLLRENNFDGFMLYEYRSIKSETADKELLNLSDIL